MTLINVMKYANVVDDDNRVFLTNAAGVLNDMRESYERTKRYAREEVPSLHSVAQRESEAALKFQQLKGAEMFLENMGYHPVWDIPGHRGEYRFPTVDECEMWEDYIYQCAE